MFLLYLQNGAGYRIYKQSQSVSCSVMSDSLRPHGLQPARLLWPWASLVAQLVKNMPAMRETQVHSLGQEDPLENGTATHSSILAWKIPWTIQSMGSRGAGHVFSDGNRAKLQIVSIFSKSKQFEKPAFLIYEGLMKDNNLQYFIFHSMSENKV